MNNLQALMDGMAANWQKERAETQMTLGTFMARLLELPHDLKIGNLINPHSYRGYYCDLAFEAGPGEVTVLETHKLCQSCMGKIFTGYKGGEFMMGEATPIWFAEYGSCGTRIVAIKDNGVLETKEDEPEDFE
ncbi:MAG: hypothetical protein DRH26_00495 [Deltaproteobacteria bacterium]|nr:MAG: hypothetical protein DRH26_00495 [Deltaproteobacteria bacterium]